MWLHADGICTAASACSDCGTLKPPTCCAQRFRTGRHKHASRCLVPHAPTHDKGCVFNYTRAPPKSWPSSYKHYECIGESIPNLISVEEINQSLVFVRKIRSLSTQHPRPKHLKTLRVYAARFSTLPLVPPVSPRSGAEPLGGRRRRRRALLGTKAPAVPRAIIDQPRKHHQ